MRLLNVETLELQEFFEEETPRYGILSHRWQKDEISYQKFIKGRPETKQKAGYRKITKFCPFVKAHNVLLRNANRIGRENGPRRDLQSNPSVDWVWIDTCCIDKTSSAELSEAINSTYYRYSQAVECYVYLQDVGSLDEKAGSAVLESLEDSEWFTRGWTLQELLASEVKIFCNIGWKVFGHIRPRYSKGGYLASPSMTSRNRIIYQDKPNGRKEKVMFGKCYGQDLKGPLQRSLAWMVHICQGIGRWIPQALPVG